MRGEVWLVLGVLAACTPAPKASVRIDVSALREAQSRGGFGALENVGLLVVRGALATLEEETQKVTTNVGVAEQETVAADTTPTSGSVDRVVVDTTLSTTSTNTSAVPARQTASADVTGALATPRLSDEQSDVKVSADDVPPVSYYPITLDAGATSFALELPAGQKQNLFLIGYAKNSSTGSALPTYVAAALDQTLATQEETTVTFIAYPAGVVIPQFLPPTKAGLKDVLGQAITSLPSDMSCLAVAKSDAPRSDFPAVSLSRVTMGSVAAQLANVGAAGLFILPVGSYRMECFAAYAGKLFGVDPNRPLQVDVAQGQVAFPTAGLVKLKDLVAAAPSGATTTLPGGATIPSGSLPTTSETLPPAQNLRFRVELYQDPNAARQILGAAAAPRDNLQTALPASLRVYAVNEDGTFNASANDLVRVEIVPAFEAARWGTDAVTGGDWIPFRSGLRSTRAIDVQLVDGSALLPDVLRTEALVPTQQGVDATFQYVAVARGYDTNLLLRPRSGARYFTVRGDLKCDDATGVNVAMFTLTDELNVIPATLVKQTYTHPWQSVLAVAVSANAVGPSRCAVNVGTKTFKPGFRLSPSAQLGLEFGASLSTRALSVGTADFLIPFAAGDSQVIFNDAIRTTDAAFVSSPQPGSVLGPLQIDTSVNQSVTSLFAWNLSVVIR